MASKALGASRMVSKSLSCWSYNKSARRASSNLPPLNEALPTNSTVSKKSSNVQVCNLNEEIKITTLSNGLKVASENSFGQFCTVGALIDAGSRYEIDYPSGVTHMLEKLAFQSTENYANNDEIVHRMESLGGHVDCQAFRDCVVYAASALKHHSEGVVEVLSESMWRANLTDTEIQEQKQTIHFELESLDFRPDVEPELTDLIHAAAFNDNTLGLPKLCPADNVELMTPTILKHFIHRYYRPDRITIAGVNVDHDELVRHCEKYFVDGAPGWLSNDIIVPDKSIAQYIGGILKDHREQPRLQPGITQLPELIHIAIGFQSAKYTDRDMFAFAVLNMLLGGGGSFSAGGPGKGMYSRLYTNVLNRSHWMFSSTAYNHSYADGGLFCIHSSAHPSEARKIMRVVTEEYGKLIMEPFNEVEVARAKKQAQSMLMMNLESRVVRFEDIGRQVLGLGSRISPQELYDSLDAVTSDDLRRISESMIASKPSVAAIGNCATLPDITYIQDRLHKRTHSSWSSKLFGSSAPL